jgi:PAS domain S-box-containing protein
MNQLPIPENDTERLKALHDYDILDSLSETEFNRITELASLICNVPISLITFIDKERQWLKSNIGFDLSETKRSSSFCQYAIMDNALFEVADATKDERFKNNEFVTGYHHFRFYAGIPLIDQNGYALGTLCVIDNKPNILNENQKKSLKLLADEVMQLIVERQQKAELRNFEKLFIVSNDLICIAGTNGYFKKVNPAFKNILGWEADFLLNTSYFSLIHPDDVHVTELEVAKLSQGEHTINFTHRFRTHNDQYRIIQWVVTPEVETGNLYAIGRDITNERKQEQQLASSEHQLKVFFENSPAFLYTFDLNGNFLSGNQSFINQIGYSKEELSKLGMKVIVSEDNREERISAFFEEIKRAGYIENESIIINKNGSSMRWTYISTLVKNPIGEDYIIINAIDTTQRYNLEEDLKTAKSNLEILSNELEKQNTKLLNFAHITSHNLRAPVSNLNSLIYFYNESKDVYDKALLFTKLETVTNHLTSTLNELIESLKIQEDKSKEREIISLQDILNKTKEILVAQLISSKAIVTSNFSEIDTIYYPRTYLESIILNLFTNAIKYASPDRVPEIHFETKKDNNQVILTVRDDGLGIDLKKHGNKLFGLNKTFHRHPDAKGVGLFIIKTQIEAMGGEITAKSEVGKGTTFKIIFNK